MKIPLEKLSLEGDLEIPKDAVGLVVFAHGSGSSRKSPRNQMVAKELNEAGLGTLLFDLLTNEEDQNPEARFDIDLLAKRLVAVVKFLQKNPQTKGMKIGLFGASTGAAAALIAASTLKQNVQAVVSRGGRADLAGSALLEVVCPTLLIVGGNDSVVIELNEKAFSELSCEKRLEVIEGASHLFEEPGTLVRVAKSARDWFLLHLS